MSPFLVGSSKAIEDVNKRIARFAPSMETVLITGPTGSGKERVAQALHALGRADEPFLPINMSAIPEALLESELFGHVRGAFTGATEARDGAFLAAGEGTLFLDEIGDLHLGLQAKLLRALDLREVMRVGSTEQIPVRARVVAATHVDLDQRVAQGAFRQDLFHRLKLLRIRVPALSERVEDIVPLAHALASSGTTLSDGALRWLEVREWPGNVRELAHVLSAAAHFAEAGVISDRVLAECDEPSAPCTSDLPIIERDLEGSLQEIARISIKAALGRSRGSVTDAAKQLGMDRKTLERRARRFGLR